MHAHNYESLPRSSLFELMRQAKMLINRASLLTLTALSMAGQCLALDVNTRSTSLQSGTHYNSQALYAALVAELALGRQQPQMALAYYQKSLTLAADAGLAQAATRLSLDLNDRQSAMEAARIWVQQAPESINAQIISAALWLDLNPQNTAKHLKQILSLDAANFDYHVFQLAQKSNAEQLGALQKVLKKLQPDAMHQAIVDLTRGEVAYLQEDSQVAMVQIDKALAADPQLFRAIELKAELYRNAGRQSELVEIFEAQLKLNPQAELKLLAASTFLDANEVDKAYDLLVPLSQGEQVKGQALVLLSEISIRQNKFKDAERLLSEASHIEVVKYEAQFALAQLAEIQQDNAAALKTYVEINHGPYHMQAYLRAVHLLLEAQAYADALYVVERIQTQNSAQEKSIHMLTVDLTILQKDFDKAQALTMQLLEEYPNDSAVFYMASQVAFETGQLDSCERHLRRVLALEPQHVQALNNLACMYLERSPHQLTEAYTLIEQAYRLSPEDPFIIDTLAWHAFLSGDLTRALQLAEQANDLYFDPSIAAHLGEIYWVAGQREAALRVWQQAQSAYPTHLKLVETLTRYNIALEN